MGSSFAFITRKDSWSRGGTERTLHEAKLVDVSIVATPAYDGATVSARSIGFPSDTEILVYAGVTPTPVSGEERRRLELRLDLLRRL